MQAAVNPTPAPMGNSLLLTVPGPCVRG